MNYVISDILIFLYKSETRLKDLISSDFGMPTHTEINYVVIFKYLRWFFFSSAECKTALLEVTIKCIKNIHLFHPSSMASIRIGQPAFDYEFDHSVLISKMSILELSFL